MLKVENTVRMVRKKRSQKKYFWWVILCILIMAVLWILFNREMIYENYRAMTYKPSEEMELIRNKLKLTDNGTHLFNVSQPVLNGRGEFNAHCRTDEKTETAVLGCYTEGTIYVFDIEDEELDGIRELTTAHELLHAVWVRMSDGEKSEIKSALEQVLKENEEFLTGEINNYDENDKHEELYVRAGTEVAKLPDVLEKNYAKVFKDQDTIVGFYNKYITVFRQNESKINELTSEMERIKAEIEIKTKDYEERLGQLNTNITEFNSCAETMGCFNSQWAFNARRAELVTEQEALNGLYTEINSLIDSYNGLVEEYNSAVIYNEKLNNMINSNAKPAEIE